MQKSVCTNCNVLQIISDTQCSIASADNQAQNSSAVKRLFLESTESTQHNNPFLSTQNELASLKCAEDELLELCSGQFPTQVSVSTFNLT